MADHRRIGLLGGSFNPPHAAHRLVSVEAMKRLGLDAVWWLVTPGNPLKDNRALPPLAERLALARQVAAHPRIVPTGIEASLGTVYTVDTIRALKRRFPRVRFVWLMGADSLRDFHRWKDWRRIAGMVPIAVYDREGLRLAAQAGRAAHAMRAFRRPEHTARALAGTKPPAWVFLHGKRSALSSTLLRSRTHGLRKPDRIAPSH